MSDLWPVNCTRSVLNGALIALNDTNYVLVATIGTKFHLKSLSGRRAADCCTYFYVGACIAAWLSASAVPRVGFFHLAISRPHQKIFQVQWAAISYKRGIW